MYCKQRLLEVKRAVLKWSQKEWTNALESLDSLSKEKDIYVKAKWVHAGRNKLFKHKLLKPYWITLTFIFILKEMKFILTRIYWI